MQMWHTESGSHASFAYLISNGRCVGEHSVCRGQLGECVKVPAHAHPPSARSRPPRCAFTYLWAVAGGACVFQPTLQIAFVLNCWCRRQCWAECKQGPKLFTLSRSRWRGWPNLASGFWCGVRFCFYTFHILWSYLNLCFNLFYPKWSYLQVPGASTNKTLYCIFIVYYIFIN